jgi:hypothetical protein
MLAHSGSVSRLDLVLKDEVEHIKGTIFKWTVHNDTDLSFELVRYATGLHTTLHSPPPSKLKEHGVVCFGGSSQSVAASDGE